MNQLKPISKQGIPEALGKAERYRLLNEPQLAESICLDILEIDPGNQQGLTTLLLAITDQFGVHESAHVEDARKLLVGFKSEYEQVYYSGLICERKGNAMLHHKGINHNSMAYEWMRDAMEYFEKAESLSPADNDDAILRWNTCVRMITRHKLQPAVEVYSEPPLE